jgi:hypothetical protein
MRWRESVKKLMNVHFVEGIEKRPVPRGMRNCFSNPRAGPE